MDQLDYQLESYNYELPEERIAQNPVVPRDNSRLLVVDSLISHRHCLFKDLPEFLRPGDLLVLNNTRVLPARLYGHKSSGAAVEVLLLEEKQHNCWLALVKPGKKFKPGSVIEFELNPLSKNKFNCQNLRATVLETNGETGGRLLKFDLAPGKSLIPFLEMFGNIPFPPYVTKTEALPEQYQTIYAERSGAVAAPTAGLHFTEELFQRLQSKGIDQTCLTLHVGVGTFRPVEVDNIIEHQMHGEWINVSAETFEKIEKTKASGGRVIAVGTTSVRALEGAAIALSEKSISTENHKESAFTGYCGKTSIFIYPGYKWQIIDGLITNFHLPKSSLLMLVSALIGRERLLNLYQQVLEEPANQFGQQYRFYSFGDAMFILPESVL
ncbi:MAG TPA: tRNA preQ1(34) S-adenosylmethionine ribosyltransferase-isomerase QueA [Planktothrix sp. UBA8407]|jgi:S-adenosylmethionine:tRNA ribosyltransferase-isomerase|nr:tRNA preQ1(34) S-adenosylmethionine ribosyltransferase-isomerase QueA [Planktothrix sp. UBA8402]HAO12710.1 tRNA preQ1(34) S-adenosylmethionine ribosyltransferase-isomerase QueA [Planktothrix sp. UBA8407]HBK24681.1 tRNA preQ1(34) S-adenosylmethionine ribosyltransferase-isomerase QueA [Planktothrix sp. UBA10369]